MVVGMLVRTVVHRQLGMVVVVVVELEVLGVQVVLVRSA